MRKVSINCLHEKLLKTKSDFIELALTESVYNETLEKDGSTVCRRPIVILNSENQQGFKRRITIINGMMDKLHKLDPVLYPKSCNLIGVSSQIIENVTSCRVYPNNAATSKAVSVNEIIVKLELAIKRLEKVPDHKLIISRANQRFILQDAIDKFYENKDRQIRIRYEGYTDIFAALTVNRYRNRPDDRLRVRISEMGLFIAPKKNYREIEFYQPELNLETRKHVVYSKLTPISIPINIPGVLYWEDEVKQLKGSLDLCHD